MKSMYEIFYDENVLNIFSDASLRHRGRTQDICYGAIAVNRDTIIDSECRINSDATSNWGELKGMLTAVYMAVKYKDKFPIINIFCDSLYTVDTMNKYYKNWRINEEGIAYNKNELVPNQSPVIESIKVIIDNDLHVNIFHQKGHVELKDFRSIQNATDVFSRTNYIRRKIDYAFIRYISGFNDIIDNYTRSTLLRFNTLDERIVCPFESVFRNPEELNIYRQEYFDSKDIVYM